jgi:hypothetical protein
MVTRQRCDAFAHLALIVREIIVLVLVLLEV